MSDYNAAKSEPPELPLLGKVELDNGYLSLDGVLFWKVKTRIIHP